MCDCSIRVTAVLEYLVSPTRVCVTISYFHCASVMKTVRWGDRVNKAVVLVLDRY